MGKRTTIEMGTAADGEVVGNLINSFRMTVTMLHMAGVNMSLVSQAMVIVSGEIVSGHTGQERGQIVEHMQNLLLKAANGEHMSQEAQPSQPAGPRLDPSEGVPYVPTPPEEE